MHADPYALLAAWMEEATAGELNDPNAMALATADAEGRPSVRMVLLKGADARGLVFYTNTESRKGNELAANARAALLFHWKSLLRQIRIEGAIERVADDEADTYYASRARLSRLGAWASAQSRPIASRDALMAALAEAEARFPGEAIPRPPHWTGFRVLPDRWEFWRDMPGRLHDRQVLTRDGDGWTASMLAP